MNKKLTIFLSTLFVLSFTFYLFFYNYVEDVKYSIVSSESLDMEFQFDGIKIIEKRDYETIHGKKIMYKAEIKRTEKKALFNFEYRANIKEIQKTIEVPYHCNAGPGKVCIDLASTTAVVPYASTTILKFSISLLILLFVHLINVKFNFLNFEKLLSGKITKEEYKGMLSRIGNFLLNFKAHLLKFLKSIIFVPILLFVFIIWDEKIYFFERAISSNGWVSLCVFLLLLPIIPAMNFHYAYKGASFNNFSRYILSIYHLFISFIILFLLFNFYNELVIYINDFSVTSNNELMPVTPSQPINGGEW